MPANNRVAIYTETIRLRIEPEQLEKLYLISRLKEHSVSYICRLALDKYIKEFIDEISAKDRESH